jgi:TRAP-type C4-dicarboxylate transport system permease small subunit
MERKSSGTLPHLIEKFSGILSIVSGVALTFVMVMTVLDVLGRAFGHSILGTYEVIGLTGAFIIGFSMPFTSVTGSHVFMEFLIEKFPISARNAMNGATRIICIILFGVIGINLFQVAAEFGKAGEVSPTLSIPVYPFAYTLGICCFLECLVLITNLMRIFKGKGEGA